MAQRARARARSLCFIGDRIRNVSFFMDSSDERMFHKSYLVNTLKYFWRKEN